jgi:tetrathionate reductase subunit B
MAACPYGMRYLHPLKGIVQKCHWCWHRLQKGTEPACVSVCSTEAIIFGDLNDREDKVYQLIMTYPVQTMKPEMGTYPHVFYIGADRTAMDLTGVREKR